MILWTPDKSIKEGANLTRFIAFAAEHFGAPESDYRCFYEWSISEARTFWEALWKFFNIRCSKEPDRILDHPDKMPGAKWFPGARLNFAENLLARRDDHPAIVFRGQDRIRCTLTYSELYQAVSKLSAALRAEGIKAGDRIAGFVPNTPEAVIAMLATVSLGAIWSSCSPDFGVAGVLDRFGQIEPRILFSADGYFFKDKQIDSLKKLKEISAQIPSVQKTVVFPYTRENFSLQDIPNAVYWDNFIAGFNEAGINFEQLPGSHPLYIMFSSGTTGKPKCIVHSAVGTLIEHLKELSLHTDLKSDDRIFYQTTCGWMMWNWLVSSLAVGATVVLYDGSPLHKNNRILFEIAEEEKITVFGTNPKFLSTVEKSGLVPAEEFDLNSIKTMLSTGSPLLPENFDFVYEKINPGVRLSSISGGTDIIGCFALGCPLIPVIRGELQTRSLGYKVEVYNEQGKPVVGEKGELVCTAPFPSMPIGFWNDPDNKRYRRAYFERFPGVWHHGDYVELKESGGMIIYGRSDAVLNPGGVRIGTAEIYRQVEKIPEVTDSVVIGQEWDGDVRVVLFVVLKPGIKLDQALTDRIKATIRSGASPFHVPKKIIQVTDIPRTRSGKTVELAVRDIVHNRQVKNIEALANPEALELFKDIPELQEQ
ncbi:MAG: acetoacetate--CoA ligase [Candidatus Dadabacteria bacterium]|nr:MAG: acetoacetate--CoA ligase [Candidatus Dadabacteria bacterium]